jgi:hypothetical protein
MTNHASKLRIALASASLVLAATVGFGLNAAGAQEQGADLTVLPPVPTDYQPKMTSWGEPDLRGTWPIDYIASLPMQRADQYGNRFFLTDEEYEQREKMAGMFDERYKEEDKSDTIGMGHWVESSAAGRRTSLLVDPPSGKLPALTEYGKHMESIGRSSWIQGQTFDWVTDFDSWDRCISRGFPASMLPFRYNNGIRVYQAPGYVVIDLEMIHDSRIIPTDGRAHQPSAVKSWMGNSVGHWEGNTLVIETDNIQPGAAPINMATMAGLPNNVVPMSDEAHVTERLTMTGPDSIEYEMTFSDPTVFTAPWTVRMPWKRNQDYEFYEYACHEGDVQVRNYITASRAQRAQAAAAKTEGN